MRAATSTVASYRTASLSYPVATARFRFNRLIPHPTVWRSFLVGVLVEGRWPTASGAELLAVAYLVGFLRDGASDPASAQIGAVRAGSVGFAGTNLVRRGARASGAGARHADAFEDGLELRAVVTVAAVTGQGQRLLLLLRHEVDLRRQATSRTSEPVIVRLGVDPTGRFKLQIPLLRAPAVC